MKNFTFDNVLDSDDEYVMIPKMIKLAKTDGNNITLD